MVRNKKNIISIILIVLIVAGIFFFGVYLGFNNRPSVQKITNILNKETPFKSEADFEPFWKVWNLINEKSPWAKDISDQDRVWGATSGLTSSLNDPYTTFFTPEENKAFEETISGEFGGVGIEIGMKDKILTVIAPLKDTPAYKAGIKTGDKIIKIDDKSTADFSIDEAIKTIRGEVGTKVKLTIYRIGLKEPKEITLTREKINIPTIDIEQKDDIFVIRLYNFSANSPELFRQALLKFTETKTSKLILDLRGNPGGYLEASIDMASWFLPEGKTVVIEDFGNRQEQEIYRSKGYDIFNENLQMIILVDGGSASASEILAGALQEHKIARLVGDKTFGKGSVQELIKVTPDTSLKITIAKWLTPNGISISENGLTPDFSVPFKIEDAEKGKDPQFDKAIELLK
ncbi:MAG: S41 family peptidase [Candidatus Paceibacterota bacterium]|jgi:carboxyl-terminal processing protease